MDTINLEKSFSEEGSGVIRFSFISFISDDDDDDEGENIITNTFLWSLTDINKNPINSKTDVSETPALTVPVLLKGDDLADVAETTERLITVKGTYDALLGGTPTFNIPFTQEYSFNIAKFKNIP